jgi:hypothetical protein
MNNGAAYNTDGKTRLLWYGDHVAGFWYTKGGSSDDETDEYKMPFMTHETGTRQNERK